MPRTYSVRNPFKHQTQSEQIRQKATSERDQRRNAESRMFLNVITRRRPPPAQTSTSAHTEMPSTSNNLHEPNLDNDEADPEQEFVFPPYDAGEDTPHDPTGLDGWDSIPWTVEGEPHRRLQPLDYLLTQEIRTTH
ncbi:hypothetical protein PCASD_18065 [Puccinia coronata f. sp. avenae]|uniref:Uncharacterized protein n=1 Tax=Puccinia coronata f. sp. avenae TaxID=200324 RepID=A0A2N5U0G7_9BASI|nr:hypothetical protein PCASD_18065 [Puccinia coronata f. sp. avenae]